jgi:hypothetical protein
MAQSIAWKRASELEGYARVGTWAARALDAYLLPRPYAKIAHTTGIAAKAARRSCNR